MDEATTNSGGGAGVVLKDPEGVIQRYALTLLFLVTNNAAEYEALIAGLRLAMRKRIQVFKDSKLAANQLSGMYDTREPALIKTRDLTN